MGGAAVQWLFLFRWSQSLRHFSPRESQGVGLVSGIFSSYTGYDISPSSPVLWPGAFSHFRPCSPTLIRWRWHQGRESMALLQRRSRCSTLRRLAPTPNISSLWMQTHRGMVRINYWVSNVHCRRSLMFLVPSVGPIQPQPQLNKAILDRYIYYYIYIVCGINCHSTNF